MGSQSENRSVSETLKNFTKDNIKNIWRNPIKTGFEGLDKKLGGGLNDLIVLGAMSGMGKSTFAIQIAAYVAKEMPVLYFSLEMPKERITAKLLTAKVYEDNKQAGLKIESHKFFSQEECEKFGVKEWSAIDHANKALEKQMEQFHIFEKKNTALEIKEKVESFLKKSGIEKCLVIVDYLQILPYEQDKNATKQTRQIVDDSVELLRDLSKENGIPVMLISSLNRMAYNKPLDMTAFKESGGIEYSADVILGLQYRAIKDKNADIAAEKTKNPREVEVVVLKQRYGDASEEGIPFGYCAKYDYFEEEKSLGPKPASRKRSSSQAAAEGKIAQAKAANKFLGEEQEQKIQKKRDEMAKALRKKKNG